MYGGTTANDLFKSFFYRSRRNGRVANRFVWRCHIKPRFVDKQISCGREPGFLFGNPFVSSYVYDVRQTRGGVSRFPGLGNLWSGSSL